MKTSITQLIFLIVFPSFLFAQIPDSCKLNIGTNLNGITDYGTEIPFVDLMRVSREWYTKSINDPTDPFDSGHRTDLSYRADGYPTHIPQDIANSDYDQKVATIWAITDGWPVGNGYTVLWEGTGSLNFWGSYENLQFTSDNRATFDYPNPVNGVVEIRIDESDINDPIHNIRVLMPGTEFTYETEPFYSLWLEKVDVFKTVRFMDWGSTNGWGTIDGATGPNELVDWSERSQEDYYTWTHHKGVPYEMMVRFMNDYDKDGWVCVPHTASEDYIRNMAAYFRDNLEPGRHIYVEYSNEIWNFIFPQAQWANQYGCVEPDIPWPEGTVPYVQNMLNYWTDEYAGQLDRTSRIVGIFTGWLDVAERMAFNVDVNSFDAISPTYYFGFQDEYEAQLDVLGANATAADVAHFARLSMPEGFETIVAVKESISDGLNKPMMFYEGGQHLTPNPFGAEPTYAQALLDVQRDTSMYNMYNEWFNDLRTLQEGGEPMLLMNFSFVAPRSARYGSWGILETMDQDISVIPAPKYEAVIENMNTNCGFMTDQHEIAKKEQIKVYPNPTKGLFTLENVIVGQLISIYDMHGKHLFTQSASKIKPTINLKNYPTGIYFISVMNEDEELSYYKIVKH